MVTMADIARICGVSRQTVHSAIHNKGGISEERRREIMEVVHRYNFQPNRLARTLVEQSANLVGATILNIRNPFFAELIQGINRVLQPVNLHTIFFETPTKKEEISAIEILLSYQVAGLIISPIQSEGETDHFRALELRKVPFVTVGAIRGYQSHFVEVENLQIGYMAAEYMLRKGHRKLCYLEGPNTIISAGERALGFLQCLRENQIAFSNEMLVSAGSTIAEGREAAMSVLRDPKTRPTALICFNDIIAVGAYEAARDLGLSIPEEISIVGCDNIDIAGILGPPLTTIALPIMAMGVASAEMLLSLIRKETPDGYLTKRFLPEFVERKSVSEQL